jgi:hypothetical protein
MSHHLDFATQITALLEGDMAEFKVRVSPTESLEFLHAHALGACCCCSPITPSEQPLGIHFDLPP